MTLPNIGAYREILSLLLELFVYSHISNDSLLPGKKRVLGKGLKKYIFAKITCTDSF